jgi:hypothetical protein
MLLVRRFFLHCGREHYPTPRHGRTSYIAPLKEVMLLVRKDRYQMREKAVGAELMAGKYRIVSHY